LQVETPQVFSRSIDLGIILVEQGSVFVKYITKAYNSYFVGYLANETKKLLCYYSYCLNRPNKQ